MPNPVAGMVGGSMVTGIMGSSAQSSAAKRAASAQQAATEAGIAEQRRQFNISRRMLQPYADAGMYGIYGVPQGGIPNPFAGGAGIGGAAGGMWSAEDLPSAVPFAEAPTGQFTGPVAGQGRGSRMRQIISGAQRGAQQQQAYDNYQNYVAELESMGLTPEDALAIRTGIPAEGGDASVQRQKPGVAGTTDGGAYQPGGLLGYATTGEGALPILQDYAQTGSDALAGQRALAGLGGADAQTAAIEALRGSPEYEQLVSQGEQAMMQNAAATGGLRGGNMQRGLMEYRPQVLVDLINRQYDRLGGLSSMGGNVAQNLASSGQSAFTNIANMGQASAAGTANNAMSMGANIANLQQAAGQGAANAQLARGTATANMFAGMGNTINDIAAYKMMGLF